jgi:hypothetical protein
MLTEGNAFTQELVNFKPEMTVFISMKENHLAGVIVCVRPLAQYGRSGFSP